jgi:cohesin complex subunit SA-1/2
MCLDENHAASPLTLAQQQETEYPLISKAKTAKSFRDLLVGFFQMLVEVLHESEVLYKDKDLMDNIHSWLGSMSSSSLRPFRHTATTIALAVTSGLVQVTYTLDHRITNIEQQLHASKRSKAKAKSFEIGLNLNEATEYRKYCTETIQSFFDTVFVHRYRDYDAKIRTECVEALGNWIWELPTIFMEPSYLRYLGWMLSDTNAATRQEVLKQLGRIFKRDAEQIGHFIDRFRPRLVEMATRDAEVSVRVGAIHVIDSLRAAALLEPNEIDSIGELIFDSELRIRKAVVGFFVACVNDVYEGKVEEIGGTDVLVEFDGVEEDDFESPRKEWANVKCLAETLATYDSQIEERQQSSGVAGLDIAVDLLGGSAPETRISLASQVLYDKVNEIKQWQILAGYLLYDHTASTKSKSKSKKTPESAFKNAVAPSTAEESILLKVLAAAVKTSIAQTTELDKGKRRGQRMEAPEAQEEIAIELAGTIPRLLNKFGAEPETATTVLRLEHFLNLGIFQQLRQDSSKYGKLLDEICTQFNRHVDSRVISEAAAALLHARQHEELEELADEKLSTLWENTVNDLRNFDKTCELAVRGNLSESSLRGLSTTLMKISKLAGISDCVDVLDGEGESSDSSSSVIDVLVNIVHRGKYEPQEDEIDDLEDEVVSYAIKACQFYFMWRTRAVSKLLSDGVSLSDSAIDRLSVLRSTYRRYLIETFSSRAAIDELRLFATGSLCDLHLTLATLRTPIERFHPSSSSAAEPSAAANLKTLAQEIEPGLIPELIAIFDGAEKQYAKKTKRDKVLNPPAEDEDPVDDEEEADEDEDEDLSKEERIAAELKAEKALCELTAKLVMAISAKVLDQRGPSPGKLRRRMLRNQTKLGHNFKEVLNYLDEEKMLRKAASSKKSGKLAPAAPQKQQEQQKSAETIEDDEDEHIFDHSEGEREKSADLEDDPIIDDEPDEEDEQQQQQQSNDLDDEILGD